jgi:hypothetical protein
MTQEQRDLLHRELSDFRGRKISSRSDERLLDAENRITPIDEIRKLYNAYLEHGITKTARSINISNKALILRFETYGLEMVREQRHIEMTEKHFDTLKLTYSEWNNKYGSKSRGDYYRVKKQVEKFMNSKDSR